MSTTMTQAPLTAPASGAYLAEVVPFVENGIASLMLLWEVPYGTTDVPLQVLQYDAGTGSFIDVTSTIFSGAVPSLANPRNVAVVDLTGSGNPDFLIAEQGLGQAPWPGATDTLLLSNAAGLLTDASANLPQTLAYSQDVSSGTIDAAGDVGVFFNNIYSKPGTAPYYLIGNGNGTFRNESAAFLPAILQATNPTYTASALVDVNGDGLADLVLGSSQQALRPSLLYLNPGNGDFANVTPIDLPASPLPGDAIILDIQPIHISSPNYDDLLVVSTNSTYTGYAVQLLINDGSGHFTDETATRLPGVSLQSISYNGSADWITRTLVTNFDANGPDIVIEGNTVAASMVLINNGKGDFYRALLSSVPILGVTTIDGAVNLIEGNSQNLTFAPYAAPVVTSITFSDPGGTIEVGQTETITVTLSAPEDGGLPTLSLNNGGTATWVHPRNVFGLDTLTFTYSPASTDTSIASLAVTALNDGGIYEQANAAGSVENLWAVSPWVTGVAQDGPAVNVSPNSGAAAVMPNPTYVQLTAPTSGAYLAEIEPFQENGVLSLLMLWEVPFGTKGVPLQVLQYSSADQTFFDDTSTIFTGAPSDVYYGTIPSLANPRNVAMVDLTGSGNPDFIIAEQGLDEAPWPGATDTLLLSNAAGLLTDASTNLPQTLAYSHDVSSGTIDGAGDVGVFVNNIYSQPDTAPYYLIGNGDGTFRNVSTSDLPASLQTTTPTYTSSALVDVNGDGLADLVLGSSQQTSWPSLVYLNPGNGDFANVTPIDLPASPLPGDAVILDIQPIHISSPNYDDLVVVSTNSTYTGYAVQLLINDGSGDFTDETATRLLGAPADYTISLTYWVERTFIANLDANGPDIITQGNAGAPSQVFVNNGAGTFSLGLEISRGNSIMSVVTIDGAPTILEDSGTILFEVPWTQPTITSITYSQPAGPLQVGQTETITLGTNYDVTVQDAVPTLSLNDGGTATYDGNGGPSDSLSFTYTVGSDDTAVAALAVTAVNQGYSDSPMTSDGIIVDVPPGVGTGYVWYLDPALVGVGQAGPSVACFATGTRIDTGRGPVAVEHLRAGDRVYSVFGGTVPVAWIGHRTLDCTRHPRPRDVLPIRVCAHAFGPGRPARDLRLSPDHAVYFEGALIPVRYLVNGGTIRQEPAAAITYYHVELPAHDVILAEGLPCESYLDTGNRAAFANSGDAIMLHPDFALKVWDTEACAELVLKGPRLTAVKRHLLQRAEALRYRMTNDPDLAVVADGQVLKPEISGSTWRVRLPAVAPRSVRLVSRTWVPAHTRVGEEDTRSLGVALANLCLDGRPLALDDPRLSSGWLAMEPKWRWTDGDAGLALAAVRQLRFDVVMTGRYWHVPQSSRDHRRMHS